MNVNRRRAASIVATVVLVAAVAATNATPAVGAPKSGTDFTIKTSLRGGWGFWGTFRANGAIADSGDASYDVTGYYVLSIYGKHGTMHIDVSYGTFWIFAADGAYSGLVGVTGTYTQKSNYKPRWTYPEEPLEWHLSQTLDGSLPEE